MEKTKIKIPSLENIKDLISKSKAARKSGYVDFNFFEIEDYFNLNVTVFAEDADNKFFIYTIDDKGKAFPLTDEGWVKAQIYAQSLFDIFINKLNKAIVTNQTKF